MKQNNIKPNNKILKWVLVIVFIIALFLSINWATYARPPLQEAIQAMESDDLVSITQEPWLTFTPNLNKSNTGLIFYPGGRIDPIGYATLMHVISSEGYLVVVPEMPINMAVFNPSIADDIIAYYPYISNWVIAGHSVGGTMAAQYTIKHRDSIDGLMIWASYPAENADISDFDIPVVSIYGSMDPGVSESSISERKHLLPEDTNYIRIEGGDHHQFGSYLIQSEEDYAVISRTSQHEQIIQASLDLLHLVSHEE